MKFVKSPAKGVEKPRSQQLALPRALFLRFGYVCSQFHSAAHWKVLHLAAQRTWSGGDDGGGQGAEGTANIKATKKKGFLVGLSRA